MLALSLFLGRAGGKGRGPAADILGRVAKRAAQIVVMPNIFPDAPAAVRLTVAEVFNSLSYEVQRRLEFSPTEPGERVERAWLWRRELKPILPLEMHHKVKPLFVGKYIPCLRMKGADA